MSEVHKAWLQTQNSAFKHKPSGGSHLQLPGRRQASVPGCLPRAQGQDGLHIGKALHVQNNSCILGTFASAWDAVDLSSRGSTKRNLDNVKILLIYGYQGTVETRKA